MDSATATHPDEPTDECVLVADDDGSVRWVSPGALTVFGRDRETIRRTGRVRDLLGPAIPDPGAVGATPVTRTVTDSAGRHRDIAVTVESAGAVTVYRCRPVGETQLSVEAVLSRVEDAVVALDTSWRYIYVNEAAGDLLGQDPADLLGEVPWDVFPATRGTRLQASLEAAMERQEQTSLEWYGETIERWLEIRCFPSPTGVSIYFRDITERKRDQQRLAAQRDELQRLNRLNELIREVNRAVVGATDRDDIESAVCTAVESACHPVAMTSRRSATDTMQVRAAVGLPADLLSMFRASGATCLEASMRRASGGTLTLLTDLQTDPDHHESLRALAQRHDLHTLVNIPIRADGMVYGVLTIGARDDDAFGDREQSVLLELGELLGTAMDAVRTKQLLHASGYKELRLAASARDSPLVALQERLDRRLTLDGVVPVDAGRCLLYLAVGATTQAAVAAAADGIDGIERARFVDSDRRPLVELTVDEATAVSALLDAGGQLRDATIEDGVGEFVVAVPLDTDVRAYLDRIEQRDIDLGLLAKREVERPAPVAWDTSTNELTTRQRTVLEAAYRSGYFDWPRRRTTGEELAESLDVASSTLHQHLRVATRKVLDEYFEIHAGDAP